MSSHPVYPCCARGVPDRGGNCRDGETWTCPACGRLWMHSCDEAEGCQWDVTQPGLEAWLRARGWVKQGGFWQLQTVRKVMRVQSPEAAKVVQDRLDRGRRSLGKRAAPGSGL